MAGSVLQGGTRRRPAHRRLGPVLGLAAAVLLVAVGAVLAFGAGGQSTPVERARPGPGPAAPGPPLRRPAPARYASTAAPPREQVRAAFRVPPRAGLLFDLRTGKVLWSRHVADRLRIASLTKMMTALVVAAREPASARVLVTRQALAYKGSGVGVLPLGRRLPLETLLYGLLLPSGNDAAIALAQGTGGTVGRFVELMNARARALDLRCTHFTSPDGFQDRGNYSCARDLARLAEEVLRRPRLARIVRTSKVALRFPIKGGKLFLYNNNPLLRLAYPGTDGLKTGFTDAAGRCLVATAHRRGVRLGVVLLHSPIPADQARVLLDRGFRKLGAGAKG